METVHEFYAKPGTMTSAGEYESEVRAMPANLDALCKVTQGLILHRDVAPFLYRVKFSPEKYDEGNVRPLAKLLAHTRAADSRPLSSAREPEKRFAGVCRHFTTMLCGLLRAHGIPARARCGFGAYFTPGKNEDHWVAEYWNASELRWILVDAQLDATQRSAFRPDFDPLDVPRDRFIIAGDAWQMCRAGRADPASFGLTHIKESGLWFIAGNVIRDLASLNNMEMLPWDAWGAMPGNAASLTPDTCALLDKAAKLTLADDKSFAETRALYEDDRLRVPPMVMNVLRNRLEPAAS
jgi:Transglutaminase-like superfamily